MPRGVSKNPEEKARKLRSANIGKKLSEETKAKISAATKKYWENPENQSEWRKKYAHLEFYPDRVCECGCKGKIPVKPYHAQSGIPRFIYGHQGFKKGKPAWNRGKHHTEAAKSKMRAGRKRFLENPSAKLKKFKEALRSPERRKKIRIAREKYFDDPEKRKEFREAMRSPERCEKIRIAKEGKPRSDFDKEAIRFGKGKVYHGADWYLTFRDFVRTACYIYEISYSEASSFIREELRSKKLTRFDIVIFLNFFMAGHNIVELTKEYNITVEDIKNIYRRIHEAYPNVFQESITCPSFPSRSLDLAAWLSVVCKF